MTDFDFDLRGSDLQVGIEMEYPKRGGGEVLADRGYYSDDLRRRMDRLPSRLSADRAYDGTVGLEVVSTPLDIADAENWYNDVLDFINAEYGANYQPVGLLNNGNTAGMHVHISPLTEDKARRLAELSQEPWMQVMFCSSIAYDENNTATWPVFRGGDYCQPGYAERHTSSTHYTCVNRRDMDHFEWRMPEPMTPENVGVLARFLSLFSQDESLAIEYAQELLDSGSEKITSILRAERVGMDIEDVPDVSREPHPDTEDFFTSFREHPALPEIYRVNIEGESFYIFSTSLDYDTLTWQGVRFAGGDVIYADTLEHADGEMEERAWQAFRQTNNTFRETEATKELKKIVKKKKANA